MPKRPRPEINIPPELMPSQSERMLWAMGWLIVKRRMVERAIDKEPTDYKKKKARARFVAYERQRLETLAALDGAETTSAKDQFLELIEQVKAIGSPAALNLAKHALAEGLAAGDPAAIVDPDRALGRIEKATGTKRKQVEAGRKTSDENRGRLSPDQVRMVLDFDDRREREPSITPSKWVRTCPTIKNRVVLGCGRSAGKPVSAAGKIACLRRNFTNDSEQTPEEQKLGLRPQLSKARRHALEAQWADAETRKKAERAGARAAESIYDEARRK